MARRPEVAVGVIVFDDAGRVLLVQRGHPPGEGLWSVPGGRVEAGETLAAACARELLTETGLHAEIGPLCEVFEHIDGDYHYVVLDYLGRAPRGELHPGDDAMDARFFTLAEVADLATTRGLLPVLLRARAGQEAPKGPR